MNQQFPIKRARANDAEWVAELIGEAFHPLPVAWWLVPDPETRAKTLPAISRILVDHALAHGQVHITLDQTAVAIWLTYDAPEPAAYQQRLAVACGEATLRLDKLVKLVKRHRPTAPHQHLALLAVRPDLHRHGLGSTLLRHHHNWLDTTRTPAYLTTGEANLNFYTRHGYKAIGTPIRLPDATPIWPMWRATTEVTAPTLDQR